MTTKSGQRKFPLEAADGIWRSRGYGYVFEIDDGDITAYDVVGDQCFPNPQQDDEIEASAIKQVLDDGDTIALSLGDEAYAYVFDQIDELPPLAAKTKSPVAVLDHAIALFDQHYAFFETRGIDWPSVTAAARAKVTQASSELQLFEVFDEMLAALKDGHVQLEAKIGGKSRDLGSTSANIIATRARRAAGDQRLLVPAGLARRGITEQLLIALGERDEIDGITVNGSIEDAVSYGRLTPDVSYLRVRSVEGEVGKEVLAALDTVIAKMGDASALFLDLRANEGGEDTVSRAIASRFTERRFKAYSKAPGDWPNPEFQDVWVEPHAGARYAGEVFVATDAWTASAGEILTLCLRAMPNVIHFGEPSEGIHSDMLVKTLPNGWTLSLSNETYRDHEGRCWEGVGVPPHDFEAAGVATS